MTHLGSLLLGVVASAAVPPQSVRVWGVGNKSCDQWLRAETQKDLAAVENVHWLSGVMSGANIIEAATGAGNVTRDADTLDTAVASIHRYCVRHPTDPVWAAAQNLIADMLERDAASRLK